jgi:hypothetical protein
MRQRVLHAGLALLVAATHVHAALAPEWYRKARAEADVHVQVAVTRVEPPSPSPGACHVEGTIAAIFRDAPGTLEVGAPISFPVSCMQAGDHVPVGGTIWTQIEDLQQARYIEAYLSSGPEGFRPALDQTRIIAAPSDVPQFPVD